MQRRLTLLKQLAKLYKMRENGESYFQNEPIAAVGEPIVGADGLKTAIENCHLCQLSKRRNCAFSGSGGGKSGVMIVLDEPSAHEDSAGKWFAGASGEIVKNIIERALKLAPESVYLTAAIKCHTAGNSAGAAAICANFLAAEIEAVKPKVIIALGRTAFESLTGSSEPVEAVRGRLWQCAFGKAVVVPSHSPNHLRLNISAKKKTADDLKLAMNALAR